MPTILSARSDKTTHYTDLFVQLFPITHKIIFQALFLRSSVSTRLMLSNGDYFCYGSFVSNSRELNFVPRGVGLAIEDKNSGCISDQLFQDWKPPQNALTHLRYFNVSTSKKQLTFLIFSFNATEILEKELKYSNERFELRHEELAGVCRLFSLISLKLS